MRNYLSTVTPHNTHTQLKHTHNFEIPGATGSHPEGAGSILRRAGDAQGAVGIGADPSHEGRPRPGGDANGSEVLKERYEKSHAIQQKLQVIDTQLPTSEGNCFRYPLRKTKPKTIGYHPY